MRETITNLSPVVSEAALKACLGQIGQAEKTLRSEDLFESLSPIIKVKAVPTTSWAKRVDSIEEPFASKYDREEYEANPALALMGLFELRLMLNSFGVPSRKQASYEYQPLEGKKFLVVGTGPGREVISLATLGGEVTGVDATQNYLKITARKVQKAATTLGRNLTVKLCQCPAENYSYPREAFNGVTSLFGVLNHVEDWQETLPKIATALKPATSLVFSMYGPNEALIFRLLEENKLTYEPSILQRRATGGILLGNTGEVLPANFPRPEEIVETLREAGLQVIKKIGYLRIAALFPKDPSKENLEAYLNSVREINKQAVNFLEKFNTPEEILLAAFLYDQRNQLNLNDFAYVAFVARKEIL